MPSLYSSKPLEVFSSIPLCLRRSLNPKHLKIKESQVAAQEAHSNEREGRKKLKIINERLESEIEVG